MIVANKKILFFITEDWFFYSHFLDRALCAHEAGYEVLVLARAGLHVERIEDAGLRFIPLEINRRSINPLVALQTLVAVMTVYKSERPALVHHVALKPILIGSLAARLLGIRHVVNSIVGMGYAFTSDRWVVRLLRPLLTCALKLLLNPPASRVVFENGDDLRSFVATGLVSAEAAVLIRGAGVNPSDFPTAQVNAVAPVVVLVARMLWDKGIGEFVKAAKMLKQQGSSARFVLVGDVDPGNRAAISAAQLQEWHSEGTVEWWGFRQDIPEVLAQASIACLPSYREGLPKSLLEAMAAGLPCITTDVPGCREAVRHGDNGLLVRPRDPVALAIALDDLIKDSGKRSRMGLRGRQRVTLEFSTQRVSSQTLDLYSEMLD